MLSNQSSNVMSNIFFHKRLTVPSVSCGYPLASFCKHTYLACNKSINQDRFKLKGIYTCDKISLNVDSWAVVKNVGYHFGAIHRQGQLFLLFQKDIHFRGLGVLRLSRQTCTHLSLKQTANYRKIKTGFEWTPRECINMN